MSAVSEVKPWIEPCVVFLCMVHDLNFPDPRGPDFGRWYLSFGEDLTMKDGTVVGFDRRLEYAMPMTLEAANARLEEIKTNPDAMCILTSTPPDREPHPYHWEMLMYSHVATIQP